MLVRDIDVFFTDNEIEDVQFVPLNGDPVDIRAIYQNAFTPIDLALGSVESDKPAIIVKTAEVPDVAHDDSITISEVTYKISGIQHRFEGWEELTRLMLTKE